MIAEPTSPLGVARLAEGKKERNLGAAFPIGSRACMKPTIEWLNEFCDLSQMIKSMRTALRGAGSPHALTDSETLLLLLCDSPFEEIASQRALVRQTALSPATISGVLESLRQSQLVTSQRGLKDRRQQIWTLTSEGKRIAGEIHDVLGKAPGVAGAFAASRPSRAPRACNASLPSSRRSA